MGCMHHPRCDPSEKRQVWGGESWRVCHRLDSWQRPCPLRCDVRTVKKKKKKKLHKTQKKPKFFSWNYEWELIWKRQIGTVTFALHVHRSTKVKNRCCKQVRMVWIKTGTRTHTNKRNFLHRTEIIRTHEMNLIRHHASHSASQSGDQDEAAVAASENWPKCVTTQWLKKK